MDPFFPPCSFGTVELNIYRSNAIGIDNFSFIKGLNLKTVLLLSPELPLRTTTEFLKAEGIELSQLGLAVWSPEVLPRSVAYCSNRNALLDHVRCLGNLSVTSSSKRL